MNNYNEHADGLAQNAAWLSIYIYHTGDHESYLYNVIAPLIQKAKAKVILKQYFFIRYFEKGSHIRLRFKTYDVTELVKLKSLVWVYFKTKNAEIDPFIYKKEVFLGLPINKIPINTIYFVEYEPEIKRYGGIYSVSIAEEQFQASSEVVLAMISQCDAFNYEDRLGIAIQLHISFAYAMSMSINDVIIFLRFYSKRWLMHLHAVLEKDQENLLKTGDIDRIFESKVLSIEPDFLKSITEFWDELHEQSSNSDYIFFKWITTNRNVNKQLIALFDVQRLYISEKSSDTSDNVGNTLFYLYDSFVHMTNNRLGISNYDESYISYLIQFALKESSY